jgi:hypothetical protein
VVGHQGFSVTRRAGQRSRAGRGRG